MGSTAQGDDSDNIRHARTSSGEDVERSLALDLGELARELQAEPNLTEVLTRITSSAVAEIDGARWAGISLVMNRRVSPEAATDQLVARLDETQTRLQEGPCLEALCEQMTVRVDDMSSDDRWPNFAAGATTSGVGSMLSVQLFVQGDNLGALNLYADQPGAFDDGDENTAIVLAAHAAVAVKAAKMVSNLEIALESRDTIGQAKGILMERYKINAVQAFDLLIMSSQRTHTKLRDVAELLAATGELKLP